MSAIAFTILGQLPSMKNSRRIVLIGKRPALIKSKDALAYEKTAQLQVPSSARQMLAGPVRFTATVFYSSQRPDLDPALLLDILAAKYERQKGKLVKIADGEYAHEESERVLVRRGVYINDRQCREIHLYHGIDKANPRAEVVIEPMEPQQGDFDLTVSSEDEADPF